MSQDGLADRARANEEGYFRKQEEAQFEKPRRDRERAETRRRLSEATGVTSEALLARIEALGLCAETVGLLDVLPAVEVAWADRVLTPREHDAVVAIGAELGVAPGSLAHRRLREYVASPPDVMFFAEARDVLAALIDAMPEMEGDMRRMDVVDFCREVAQVSGGLLTRFGLGDTMSPEERETIGRVSSRLRTRRPWAAVPDLTQ